MEETANILKITVEGLVQAVGFRPFVSRLAAKHRLTGLVRNTTRGVEILVEGPAASIDSFTEELDSEHPPLAVLKSIQTEKASGLHFERFEIALSGESDSPSVFIPPDIACCHECEQDFNELSGRYYRYPFVNCTNCGPRFSIITGFPYDRRNSTMAEFALCAECSREYGDIDSRRYHAEPVSCSRCGPHFSLLDAELNPVRTDNVFKDATALLAAGSILAVKGIGGYHLVLDATNDGAVSRIRDRKKRDRKPFALMFRDIETIEEYCMVSKMGKKLLTHCSRPIVLLPIRKKLPAAETITGSSPWYGAMLPYAPFHHILLEKLPVLIFTSGNLAGEPIVYRDDELERIKGIADGFVTHNRTIARFVEDSVVRVVDDEPLLLRKSRGYAPSPLFLDRRSPVTVAGMGSDLKASISLLKEDSLIQSQYLGDLADIPSYEDYMRSYDGLREIFQIEPAFIACDLHPSYLSSRYADSIAAGRPLIRIQHHKAHVASVALEQNWYDEPVIGLALDGTGYGEDGHIWGGEIFTGSLKHGFIRAGMLRYLPFPFGDAAVREPQKTALSFFTAVGIDASELLPLLDRESRDNYDPLRRFINNASLRTSSTGRLFDAVSWLLGFRRMVSFEGEAAIELENMLYPDAVQDSNCTAPFYPFPVTQENDLFVLDTCPLLRAIFADWKAGTPPPLISLRFHQALVAGFTSITAMLADRHGISRVVLSGGCFQNAFLLKSFGRILRANRSQWATNRYSPPNDACISVGQCAIAGYSR